MKKFFTFFFLMCLLIGCGPEKTVRIGGTLSGTNAEQAYLRELGGNEHDVVDSVKLDANGNFSFKQKNRSSDVLCVID